MDNNFYTPEELAFLENNPQQQQQLPEPPEQASQVHCSPSMITSTPEEQMLAAQSKLNQYEKPVSVAHEVVQIIAGLIFMLVPMFLGVSFFHSMRSTVAYETPVTLMPFAFLGIFIIVGLTNIIKSIVRLVKMLKEK